MVMVKHCPEPQYVFYENYGVDSDQLSSGMKFFYSRCIPTKIKSLMHLMAKLYKKYSK